MPPATLLQRIFAGTSREGCCFDTKSANPHVGVCCHEVRGFDVSDDEEVFFSVRDVRNPGRENPTELGGVCQVRRANIDTTLLVRFFKSNRQSDDGWEILPCAIGEVRIPLAWTVTHCNGVLYQSWASVEPPSGGIDDSFDTITDDGQNADSYFAQKLLEGESLTGLRVCLSVCRLAELGWGLSAAGNAPPEVRINRWAALLFSQKQHIAISEAMHKQDCSELDEQQTCTGDAFAKVRKDIAALEEEIDANRKHANDQIDVANQRIRAIRQERDDNLQEYENLQEQGRRLETETAELMDEARTLTEQKEALMAIVEDLHRTCAGAGLEATNTETIGGDTNFNADVRRSASLGQD